MSENTFKCMSRSFLPILLACGLLLHAAIRVDAQSLGEALNAPENPAELVWVTGGDADWYGQSVEAYDGSAAGRSGLIGHHGISWVETTVEGPGVLSFRWKVSSESHYDFFEFSMNGEEETWISGEVDWREESFEIPAGEHVLRWSYTKDDSESEGADGGWLDEVSYVPYYLPLEKPTLGLERAGAGLELVVQPDPQGGVVHIYRAPSLKVLADSPDYLDTINVPTEVPLRIPVEATADRLFFQAIREHGDASDFVRPDIPDESGEDVGFSLWTLGLSDPPVRMETHTVDFLLVSSFDDLYDYTGEAELIVVRLEDGEPHPDALVSPGTIYFEEGASRAEVTITASLALEGYRVAVRLPLSAPAGIALESFIVLANTDRDLVLRPFLTFPDALEDKATAFIEAKAEVVALVDKDSTYQNPLPTYAHEDLEVAGTFGEWRGHARNGVPHSNVHTGLDIVVAATTEVCAARGGIITKTGSALGRYVVISHLDGWYTRYLHLAPHEAGEPLVGDYVERGALIGKVGTKKQTAVSPHLHFEIRNDKNPALDSALPGVGQDPLQSAGMFTVRTPQKATSIKEVGVTPFPPFETNYERLVHPVKSDGESIFAVLQIVHEEPRTDQGPQPRRLSPRTVKFKAEDVSEPLQLTAANLIEINARKPASKPSDCGFAVYRHGEDSKADWSKVYKYWFRWDVSGYAADPVGPARCLIKR